MTAQDALNESVAETIGLHRDMGRAIVELKKRGEPMPAKTANPTAAAIAAILDPLAALSTTITSTQTDATSTDAENVTDLISELVGALTSYASAYGGLDFDSGNSDDDEPVSGDDDSSPMGEAMRKMRAANAKVFRETRRAKAPNCLVA